jgi:hypothetical protein
MSLTSQNIGQFSERISLEEKCIVLYLLCRRLIGLFHGNLLIVSRVMQMEQRSVRASDTVTKRYVSAVEVKHFCCAVATATVILLSLAVQSLCGPR